MTQLVLRDPRGASLKARHSSKTSEHYSPPLIVEPARATLGGIDLDPASCPLANTVVGAGCIYTEADHGLELPWTGRTFLNPPGGKEGSESVQATWWFRLAEHWMAGAVEAAIFVGFSVEVLQVTQCHRPRGLPVPAELPHCFPSSRVKYLKEVNGALVPGTSPPHSSVITYLPPRASVEAWEAGVARFRENFSPLGILCGALGGEFWCPKSETPAGGSAGVSDARAEECLL
ncbi:hypothetical protein [Sorangium sp. So ce388]|uniref:hypothetical protein n=1 Tax=Sorangium sp. So ce388 TaxID=3133309 RepID=UPI003F5CA977